MTRPARIRDAALAKSVREHMNAQGLSVAALADMLAINKSTLSRSLAEEAFSRKVRQRIHDVVDPLEKAKNVEEVRRKALRLIIASDRLRERADRMLIEALDQSIASK